MSPATLTDSEARQRVLRAADDLFYRRGVTGVTMAQVRDASAVSLRRLYVMYPNKSDLVAAWLESRHHSWLQMFTTSVADRLASGAARSDAIFEFLADWLVATDYRGCGFINSLAEVSATTSEHRDLIREHKAAVIEVLAEHSDQPEALAVLVDGAIVQAAIFRSRHPVEAARQASISLLKD